MNDLTTAEFVPLLQRRVEKLGPRIRDFALDFIEGGQATIVIGSTPDREPTEDVETELDVKCEKIIYTDCQAAEAEGLRVWIISEHHPEGYGHENPNVLCFVDSFDGTDQSRKKNPIWEAWYSVLSFTTLEGQPLVGMCVDIVAGILYIADAVNKKVWRTSLRTGKKIEVFPSQETELNGESVVASYKGKWSYLSPWYEMVRGFFKQKHLAGVTHYSWGGSFVYALLAAGMFSTYIMMREPTDEIRPGRAFVEAAGLSVYSVTENGVLRPFKWEQKRRVLFFIVAPNKELAQSVVDGIWEKNGKDGLQDFAVSCHGHECAE